MERLGNNQEREKGAGGWKKMAAAGVVAAGVLALPEEKNTPETPTETVDRFAFSGSFKKMLVGHHAQLSPDARQMLIGDAERRYSTYLKDNADKVSGRDYQETLRTVFGQQPDLPVEALEGTALDPQKLLEQYAYVALWVPNKSGAPKLILIPPGKKWNGFRKAAVRHFGNYSNAYFIGPTKLLVARHAFRSLEDAESRKRPTATDLAIVHVRPDQAAPADRIVPTDFSLAQEDIEGKACVTVGYDPDAHARPDGSKFEAGFCAPAGGVFTRLSQLDPYSPHVARSLMFPISPGAARVQRDIITQTPRSSLKSGTTPIPHFAFMRSRQRAPFAGMSSSAVFMERDGKPVLAGTAWGVLHLNDGERYRDIAFMHPVSEAALMMHDPANHHAVEMADTTTYASLLRKAAEEGAPAAPNGVQSHIDRAVEAEELSAKATGKLDEKKRP